MLSRLNTLLAQMKLQVKTELSGRGIVTIHLVSQDRDLPLCKEIYDALIEECAAKYINIEIGKKPV